MVGIRELYDEIIKIIKEKMKGRQIPIQYKTGKKIEHKLDGIGKDFAKIMDDVGHFIVKHSLFIC